MEEDTKSRGAKNNKKKKKKYQGDRTRADTKNAWHEGEDAKQSYLKHV